MKFEKYALAIPEAAKDWKRFELRAVRWRCFSSAHFLACVSFHIGCYRYQEVGNDVTAKRAIDQFSEFAHLVSQRDHACGKLRLCRPEVLGRPLGIRKIVAVGAPMQT